MTKKEKILQVALVLFGQKGFDGVSTRQIAEAAEVSEALIFRHYKHKAGLLAAIIEEGLRQIAETMRFYHTETDPKEAIAAHIDAALTSIQARADFWRLATQLRFRPEIYHSAGDQIAAANRFIVGALTENFRRLDVADPEREALLLFALIDGICLQWLQAPADYPIETMRIFLLNKFQDGQF